VTELVRKTGRGFAKTAIVLATAFGGGLIGAVFNQGIEHQKVAALEQKVAAQDAFAQGLVREDTGMKERISVLENTIKSVDTQMSTISSQHQDMIGDLGIIKGELQVLLRYAGGQNTAKSTAKHKGG